MGLARQKAKGLETAVSICILTILIIIGAVILVRQANYDISRFGVVAETAVSGDKVETDEQVSADWGLLVCAELEPFSKAENYNAENLFEKINGKAPAYIESGFEGLSAQRFVKKGDRDLMAEIYVFDMGTAKNAFAVYSTQKRADVEEMGDLGFAYKTANSIYLATGRYYVEMIGFSKSQQLLGALEETAGSIRRGLVVEDESIAELGLFPQENIITGSAKLYLNSAFGFEGLNNTFAARYRTGEETVMAFFSEHDTAENAQRIAGDYYKFLIDNGGEVRPLLNRKLAAKVVDLYGEIEIVFAVGRFLGGIHGAQSQNTAEEVVIKLIEKLNTVAIDD